jgi:uncharacterized protein YoxC
MADNQANHKQNHSEIYLGELADNFQVSARRWEIVVYPSLIAFIILAIYGFYLVFNLTRDVHTMSLAVDRYMGKMSQDIGGMTNTVSSMEKNMNVMTQQVAVMNSSLNTLDPMAYNMGVISNSTQKITHTMNSIKYDVSNLTHDTSRPMSFINSFAPW